MPELETALRLKREKRYQEAWALFEELAAGELRSPYFWSNYAHLAYLLGRYRQAREFVETALSLDPESRFSRALYAGILLRNREITEALRLIDELMEEQLEVRLLRRLVKVAESLGQLPELETRFNTWLVRYGDRLDFLGVAAEYFQKCGRHDRAIELYTRIVSRNREDTFAYERLIDLKTRGKTGPEKIRELETVLRLPSQEKNVHLLGLLAREYKKANRFEPALRLYRRILTLDPHNWFEKKQMGFLYARMGSYPQAMEVLGECLLQDPDDHFVRQSFLAACRRTANQERALQVIDQILIRHPEKKNYLGIRKKVVAWKAE
jgi:tetratricopeptide (TPR) repeat protein